MDVKHTDIRKTFHEVLELHKLLGAMCFIDQTEAITVKEFHDITHKLGIIANKISNELTELENIIWTAPCIKVSK